MQLSTAKIKEQEMEFKYQIFKRGPSTYLKVKDLAKESPLHIYIYKHKLDHSP